MEQPIPVHALSALEAAEASAQHLLADKQKALNLHRQDKAVYEDKLEGQNKAIAEYEASIKMIEAQISEYRWAFNLISRATTVDKEFLAEVWSDDEQPTEI